MSEAWSQWEGQVINGEFRLNKYLGGSEQSAVFLTEDRGLKPQPAAIKLIAADPASAELQLSRWGLAQKLSHPQLLRLLHTGRCRMDTRELIFAVMEYAEENLAQILPYRPLTPPEAHEMLGPTLDALAYLHGQGFVHSHLKPANVLAINDQLKLSSDGICRTNNEDGKVSAPEKPSIYDPPEMASGLRSPAADVWSLGVTLAEVLTQHLPSWNAQSDTQSDPVVPENLPAPFLDIVRGCLRRDPQRRLTIAGIAARLHVGSPQPPARVADAKPLPQKPPSVPSRGGSWLWRSAFPVVVVVVVVVALFTFLRHQSQTQPQTQHGVATVKPEQKPESQKPGAQKPSPKTPATKTSSLTTKTQPDQQPGSASNRIDAAPAAQMKPRPASLQSEAQAPAGNSIPDSSPTNGSLSSSDAGGVGVVEQVLPNVPQKASDTIQGTLKVSVRVKVDPSGSVVGADLVSPGPSKYFARLASEAAQSWKFAPSGQDAGREFVLYFEFRNTGTKAFATRAGR